MCSVQNFSRQSGHYVFQSVKQLLDDAINTTESKMKEQANIKAKKVKNDKCARLLEW